MRIGFIGAGRRAQGHMGALSKIKSAQIAAICDIQRERAEEVARRFNA
ncbi:TPA: gfo/Idh/MocA family oxidoreductase, partial [Candidatus Poribacteria bacterium]|nr:gfo/Idh/MocA family oxidoreductase [Candidatus Poribacteria bacterium]HEX28771.1 gfo/Idh/MocA family oxidoreductase [Candidatus Poribacteria bacterium]